jgi:hypothetical protein
MLHGKLFPEIAVEFCISHMVQFLFSGIYVRTDTVNSVKYLYIRNMYQQINNKSIFRIVKEDWGVP